MPLVTQLGESVQPLVFPTDLSINTSSTPPSTSTTTTQIITTITNKKKLDKNASALRESSAMNIETHASASSLSLSTATTPIKTERLADGGSGRSTPHHKSHLRGQLLMSADNDDDEDDDDDDDDNNDLDNQHPRDHHRHHGGKSVGKLKHLTEEEATALMLKAVAEKGSSGNLSDNSYSEENSVVAAAAATAAAFADAGLCNINILNSISAMNSLIGANNGALSLTSSSAASGVTGTGNNNVGSTNNSSGNNIAMMSGIGGHPCPECGRVYKLKSSLRNHQKWECGKEPQFQCPFCVYRAKQKMHIGRHMERMHKEKFVKLDDLKSYSSAAGSSGGVSHSGGIAGDNTGTGSRHTSGHDDPVSDLRQHFS